MVVEWLIVGILLIAAGCLLCVEGLRRFFQAEKKFRETTDKGELNDRQVEWEIAKSCFQHLPLIVFGELVIGAGGHILYTSS